MAAALCLRVAAMPPCGRADAAVFVRAAIFGREWRRLYTVLGADRELPCAPPRTAEPRLCIARLYRRGWLVKLPLRVRQG